jgi:hypothetical protein
MFAVLAMFASLLCSVAEADDARTEYYSQFWGGGYMGNTGGQGIGFYGVAAGPKHGLVLAMKGNADGYDGDAYYENLSYGQVAGWGDRMTDEVVVSRTYELAYGRRVARPIMIYAGLGYTTYTCYREHFDPCYILGTHGHYWIAYPVKNHKEIDIMVGAMLFVSRSVHLMLGYQTEPAGVNIGIGLVRGSK